MGNRHEVPGEGFPLQAGLSGKCRGLRTDFIISLPDSSKSKPCSDTQRIRICVFHILGSLESHCLGLPQVRILTESYSASLRTGLCFQYSFRVFCFQMQLVPKRGALPISPYCTDLQVLRIVSVLCPPFCSSADTRSSAVPAEGQKLAGLVCQLEARPRCFLLLLIRLSALLSALNE